MATSFDAWILEHLLLSYDIFGAEGCHPALNRKNMLVEITDETHEIDDKNKYLFNHWSAEGFGFEAFTRQYMEIPRDTLMDEAQVLIWDAATSVPMHQKIWLLNVEEMIYRNGTPGFTYVFDQHSFWTFVPSFEEHPTKIKVLEWFAGGFGGWKHAGQFLRTHEQIPMQFVAVEASPEISAQYALTHRAHLIAASDRLPDDLFLNDLDWIVQADVFNLNLRKAVHTWMPTIICISSPCPPWSTAAASAGLHSKEGLLLAQSILEARFARPAFLLIEQVAGFAFHKHKPLIEQLLLYCGFQLIFQKTLDLKDVSQPARLRWLGIARRVRASVMKPNIQAWPRKHASTFPNPQLHLPESLRHQTIVTAQMEEVASSLEYAKHKTKGTPAQILQAKIFQPTEHLPTFMARYGTQHLLEKSLLKEKGYFGHFVHDSAAPKGFRLWHPSEVVLAHGLADVMHIPNDFILANKIVGNMIAVQHALYLLTNTLPSLNGSQVNMMELFDKFRLHQFGSETSHLFPVTDGHMLIKRNMLLLNDFCDAAQQILTWKHEIPMHAVWTPKHGLIEMERIHQLTMPRPSAPPPSSQLTDAEVDIEDTLPDTLIWQPLIRGEVQMEDTQHMFWYSADLPGHVIAKVWDHAFEVNFQGVDQATTAILKPTTSFQERDHPTERCCAVLLIEQELNLISVEPKVALLKQHQISSVASTLYDQFGQIAVFQTASFDAVLTDRPLLHQKTRIDLVYLIAAFRQVQICIFERTVDHAVCFSFQGPEQSQQAVIEFWNTTCAEESCSLLGRRSEIANDTLSFAPCSHDGVAPPTAFKLALAICAARTLLDQLRCEEPDAPEVLLKWDSRPLWRGALHPSHDIRTIAMILCHALFPISKGKVYRIVSKGKQQAPETTMECLRSTNQQPAPIVLFAVMEMHGGGAKQQQKAIQQNALATAFLEQGHPLDWTAKTVDSIVDKVSLHRLQSITSQPKKSTRIQSLMQLCEELKIQIPEPPKPQSRAVPTGAPWQRKKKKEELPIQLGEFTLVNAFFMNEDGSPATQIQGIRPQATGVCLMNDSQAAPILKENQKLSSDELAILVVGHQYPENVPSDEVTFPCTNANGQDVLLYGRLYQLGSKQIKINQGNPQQVPATVCQLTAITIYKEDWPDHTWMEAVHSTSAFIRKVLQTDQLDKSLQAIWGRSLRNGRSPASPNEAISIQVHATIDSASFGKLLQKSGFNKLYLTPKQQTGRPTSEYRIIWLHGECSVPKAIAISAQTSGCAGLVKGKNGALGLRYPQPAFDAAWQVINPKIAPPTDFQGDQLFKIENLPFGTSHQMLSAWAEANQWTCKPFRALEPTSWLVKAADAPPAGLLMFNTSPLLIRLIQSRDAKKTRLVLGPRQNPTYQSGPEADPWAQADPWSNWKPARPALQATTPVARNLEGPIEAKFDSQEQKISAIRTELDELAQKHEKHAKAVQEEFAIAKQREAEEFSKVHYGMKKIQSDLDNNLANTMKQHSQAMEQQFRDLKALFQQLQKRSKPDAGDDPME